ISGRPMTGSHGHGSPGWYVDGAENIRRTVRENVKRGADFTKILLRDLTPTSASYTEEEVRAAVDETHRARRKVHAHPGAGAHSLELALENGVDSIAHATPVCQRDLDLYLESGGYVVRTFSVSAQTGLDLTRLAGKSIEARLRELDTMVKAYLEDPDKHS